VIRRLYGRPLETLLATWGVSLILQQFVRSVSTAFFLGLLAAVAAFGLAGLANYLYRYSFPATFAVLGAVAVTVAVGLVACVNRFWELQDPRTDFNGQLAIGLVMVFEGIVVLTAIAIAALARMACSRSNPLRTAPISSSATTMPTAARPKCAAMGPAASGASPPISAMRSLIG
jgi:hypothetical protein